MWQGFFCGLILHSQAWLLGVAGHLTNPSDPPWWLVLVPGSTEERALHPAKMSSVKTSWRKGWHLGWTTLKIGVEVCHVDRKRVEEGDMPLPLSVYFAVCQWIMNKEHFIQWGIGFESTPQACASKYSGSPCTVWFPQVLQPLRDRGFVARIKNHPQVFLILLYNKTAQLAQSQDSPVGDFMQTLEREQQQAGISH